MLPSMPLLFSLSRDSVLGDENKPPDDSTPVKTNTDLKQTDEKPLVKLSISNEIPSFSFGSIPEDERECADELVLLAENSPFGEKRKLLSQPAPTRKKRKVETVELLLEDRNSNDEQANHFAMAYFMKAKGELDEQTFQKFIALLSEQNEDTVDVVLLYKEICSLLSSYPELADEFIGFLHPHQAMEADKLTELMEFEQGWTFFRKLDAFHLNKVNHLLEQHVANLEITNEALRSSFHSSFKGHPNISEGFFGLLPNGKPPLSTKEDYEDITDMVIEDSSWERLNILDSTSRGCIPITCNCVCHTLTTKKFCTFCNVKFSKGQIYVQTGKGLRFAKVTFCGLKQEDVLRRLNPTIYDKPIIIQKKTKSATHQNKENHSGSDQNPKNGSITKDTVNSDKRDIIIENEIITINQLEEDDEIIILEAKLDSDNMNFDEQFILEDVVLESTNSEEGEDMECDGPDEIVSSPISAKLDEDSHNSHDQVNEAKEEDYLEISMGGNESGSNLPDISFEEDSNHSYHSVKSGLLVSLDKEVIENPDSSMKEETVMDVTVIKEEPILDINEVNDSNYYQKNEDQANDSSDTVVKQEVPVEKLNTIDINKPMKIEIITDKSSEDSKVWTREEDKLILQAFQQQLGTEQTFSKISDLMPSRSVDDIQGRFQVLMNLLEKMTNGCYENYPA